MPLPALPAPLLAALHIEPPYPIDDQLLPSWMFHHHFLDLFYWQWLGIIVFFCLSLLVAWVLVRVGRWVADITSWTWDDTFFAKMGNPLFVLLWISLFWAGIDWLRLGPDPANVIVSTLTCTFIGAATWGVIRLMDLAVYFLKAYWTKEIYDPIRKQALVTQITVPQQIFRFLGVIIGVGLILAQFEFAQKLGLGLLAWAGGIGLVLTFAAQRTFGNLFAGLQLALFQPIKLNDSVVVEGEWGWIEQIGLTHVVIRIWDLRRLVLPVSYFLDHPFQNWSKKDEDLLGTVFLYVDYSIPIDELEKEFFVILDESSLWDRNVRVAQITSFSERAIEIRLLMSACGGPALWDLRCLVRRRILAWLQRRGCANLPLQRVDLDYTRTNAALVASDGSPVDALSSTPTGLGGEGGPTGSSMGEGGG
jgi:small-conductance mechanosensitive channel